MVCVPLILGVWIRIRVPNFLAADLSFEATILIGLLLGTGPAMLGGAALALPAMRPRRVLDPARQPRRRRYRRRSTAASPSARTSGRSRP